MNNVAQRIKELRIENGLTQEELAENIITRSYLSQIERGSLDPSYNVLEKLAKKLDCNVEGLLTQQPKNKNLTAIQIRREIKNAEKSIQESKYNKAQKIIENITLNGLEKNITNEEKGILSWIYGKINKKKEDLPKAVEFYKKSADFLEEVNDEKAIRSLTDLGYVYSLINKDKEALRILDKASRIAIYEYVDGHVRVEMLLNLGIVHGKLREMYSAVNFLREAEELNRLLGIFYRSGELSMALGICYMQLEEIESAKKNYLNAVDFFTFMDNTENLAGTLNNLGILYRQTGDIENAICQFEKSIDLFERLDNTIEKCTVELELARTLLGKNDYECAYNRCNHVIDFATDNRNMFEAYELLGDMEKDKRNYSLAINQYDNAGNYLDETHSDDHKRIKKKTASVYHIFGDYEKASSIFFHFLEDEKRKMPQL